MFFIYIFKDKNVYFYSMNMLYKLINMFVRYCLHKLKMAEAVGEEEVKM
jgi:hypothetical protein